MRNSKSICLIVQSNYESDARVRRKAESLVNAGYEVDVISLPSTSHPHARKYDLEGVTVYTLPVGKKRGSFFRYTYEYGFFFILAFLKVTRLMLKKRYRIVDVNTLPDFLVFAAIIPKWLGAKIVLDMHEVMPEFYMSKYNVSAEHRIIRLIMWQEKKSINFADHVLAINEPIRNVFESRGLAPGRSSIIMNSVNEEMFSGEKFVEKHRQSENFVLMYHGTLTHIYGLDIALRAFAKVQNEMKRAEFWIVGEGPEREDLERIVKQMGLNGKVKFTGMVPQDDIPKLLVQCNAGVLATRQDIFLDLSFSNKLPEYIFTGKPVIASRLKTLRRYFSEEALAYFEPHNVQELSNRMLELYNDPQKCQKLKKQARREYGPINWNIMKRRYLKLIETFAGD